MRIMSKQSNSMVYHRPECSYAKRIYKRNRIKLSWQDAEWKGYRPCKCCNNMKFLYQLEQDVAEKFCKNQHNMDMDLVGNLIYVRTDVGCWKIHYKTHEQKFILFHRNYVKGHIPLSDVEKVPYHRQKDMYEAGSILKLLRYIQSHDEFRQFGPTDYRQMPQRTRQQRYYYHAAKRRQEKRTARRVDYLFRLIEQKEGIKELSVW